MSNPVNPPISSVQLEIPLAATFTPAVTCCRSTLNSLSVSPLHRYEQNLCPPRNVERVRDMYSQEVEAPVSCEGDWVRLEKSSSMA